MTTQLARIDDFAGTHTDAGRTTALLQRAQQEFNLVSPAPAVAQIPEGCAIALAAVFVDPELDTYPIPGGPKRGISKPSLDKIALALGLTMIPEQCGRLDDGSHPYYVHYRWVGRYRQFDGQLAFAVGEKRMDLREGSAMVENLRRIAAKKGRDCRDELAQMRAFIVEHAETKARLRAIRSLGMKTSYERSELAKPFVAARLQFTGDFKDEGAKQEYRRALTNSFMGATVAAYGGAPVPAPAATALPNAAPVHRLPPPPVDHSAVEDDDVQESPPPGQAPRAAPAGGDQVRHAEGSEGFRLPAKKGAPRKTLVEAGYDDLTFWRGRIAQSLAENPDKQYADKDRDLVAAIDRELAARDGTSSDDEAPPAAAATPAVRAPLVPKGLPGEGRPLRDLSMEELAALSNELVKRLAAAEKSGAGTPEQRAKAERFLEAVTLEVDARRAPAEPAASGSDDEFLAGLGDAE